MGYARSVPLNCVNMPVRHVDWQYVLVILCGQARVSCLFHTIAESRRGTCAVASENFHHCDFARIVRVFLEAHHPKCHHVIACDIGFGTNLEETMQWYVNLRWGQLRHNSQILVEAELPVRST